MPAMKESIRDKLDQILDLKQRLQTQLSDQAVVEDMNKFQRLSKELHQVEPIAAAYEDYLNCKKAFDDAKILAGDSEIDQEMAEMAQDEIGILRNKIEVIVHDILCLLIPVDPDDDKNVYLEIRAGAGGDEDGGACGDHGQR